MPYQRPIPDDKPPSKLTSATKTLAQAEKMTQIALVMPCAVLIGWGGGAWLDGRLHQTWITVVGIIVGSAAGLASAVRMAMAAAGDPKNAARADKGNSGNEK
ncbi:MAG: AtpZ/AtpI family protein [Terracidiphilus sp.]